MDQLEILILALITFGIFNFHKSIRGKRFFLIALTITTPLLVTGIFFKINSVNHYQIFFAPSIVLVLLKAVQQTFVDLTGREYELNIRGFESRTPTGVTGSIDTIVSILLLITIMLLLITI